jgi:kynurenine formamidase
MTSTTGRRETGLRRPAELTVLVAVTGVAGLVACTPGTSGDARADGDRLDQAAHALLAADGARWVDLTHPFDGDAIYWPTAEGFELVEVADGVTDAGFYYAANRFSAAEHGGTHMDAPIHFHEGGASVEEVALERMIGPAAVVDVRDAVGSDADYRVTVDDLLAWEEVHGRIPAGALVLIRTGWERHWPDPERYLGTARRGQEAVSELHFPGLHPDAARWLVEERTVDAVGLDTPSIDHGPSTGFMAHRILYAAGVPGLENLARLGELPATGAYVVALPMKIAGGSGAPLRIVGVVPRRPGGSD